MDVGERGPQPSELPPSAPMPLASQPAGTPPAAATPAVEPLVKAWATAWAAKDVKSYFNFYSPRFKPEQGSLAEWTKRRTQRISRPGNITVEVDKLEVRNLSANTAEAHFVQRYRSPRINEAMNKTLQYELENGQWKIVRESNR